MHTTVDGLLSEAIRFDEECSRLRALRNLPDGRVLRLRPTDPLAQAIDEARDMRERNLAAAAELELFVYERTTR